MTLRVNEATCKRIRELCWQKRMTEFKLIELAKIPPSTFKSILGGRSKNPGIGNIRKIAGGLGISVREFFDSELFDDLDLEE